LGKISLFSFQLDLGTVTNHLSWLKRGGPRPSLLAMTHHRVEKVPKVPVIGVCIKPRLLGPWGWAEFAAPLEGPPRLGGALLALETHQSRGAPQGVKTKKEAPRRGPL